MSSDGLRSNKNKVIRVKQPRERNKPSSKASKLWKVRVAFIPS